MTRATASHSFERTLPPPRNPVTPACLHPRFITFAMPSDTMQSRRTLAVVVMMLVGGAVLGVRALSPVLMGPCTHTRQR